MADWVALALTVALLGMMALGTGGVVREWLAVVVVLCVPGWAVVGRLAIGDLATEGIVTVALSIAIGTVASMIGIWSHWYRPDAIVVLLGVSSAVALGQRRAVLGRRQVTG